MGVRNQKDVLENLDLRLGRIEQILPTLATKEDLLFLATKEDLLFFATKEDLLFFATKEDLREEGERSRRHMDVVVESLLDRITLIAEGHGVLNTGLDSLKHETRARLANHDLRITRLEAKRPRR